jgi:hypothetical protein
LYKVTELVPGDKDIGRKKDWLSVAQRAGGEDQTERQQASEHGVFHGRFFGPPIILIASSASQVAKRISAIPTATRMDGRR